MLRKVSAVITCLLFTLGSLTLGLFVTEPAEAYYTEFKEVTWIVHYEDEAGNFCWATKQVVKVGIQNNHYKRCHRPGGGGEDECKHPHESRVVQWQNSFSTATIPECC